jgi:predicted enzyme related to lactoylglutathione lyase
MKLAGAMIGSDQPDVLGAFYAKVLGEPGFRDGTWWGWSDKADLMIGAHSDVSGHNKLPQRIMLMLEVPDVTQAFKEITAMGAKVVAEPYHPQENSEMMLATVEDPDGNYVQLAPPWDETM